jgi:hypothetical protein
MTEQDELKERQQRIDAMIAEFAAARQRRLAKIGMVLWKRAEALHFARSFSPPVPEKIH